MEIWKDIEGYEGLYQVSNLGNVMRNGKILTPRPLPQGYTKVNLSKNGKVKDFRIHRLVAAAFIINPDKKETVNHINGIKNDNRVCNLEWMTQSENAYHSYKHLGRISKGGAPIGNTNWKKTIRDNKGKYVKSN